MDFIIRPGTGISLRRRVTARRYWLRVTVDQRRPRSLRSLLESNIGPVGALACSMLTTAAAPVTGAHIASGSTEIGGLSTWMIASTARSFWLGAVMPTRSVY